LSVLQYAIDVLAVRHVIVTGHYGCGGVRAVFERATLGLIDNWLRHVEHVREQHEGVLAGLPPAVAVDRLCELNVIEQARHVCETTVVRQAWGRGQQLTVHGWVYGLRDGRLCDLGFAAERPDEVIAAYQRALNRVNAAIA
jgi:carbonic anhydrase